MYRPVMMNVKKQILLFCFVFFGVQVAVVITQSFYVAYLESKEIPSLFIGIGSSIMAGFGILGQFTISYLCDKNKKIKKYYFFMLFMLVLSVYILYKCNNNLSIIFFNTALSGMAINTIVGLVDSWSLKSGIVIKRNYGGMRAAGSFALFLSAIIIGSLVTKLGYQILSVAIMLVFAFLVLSSKNIPDIKPDTDKNIDLSCLKELFSNKKYLFLVVTYFCVFLMTSAELLLLGMKLNYLGGTSAIGMFFGIQALSEIPTMLLYKKLCKKISAPQILIIATLFYVLREVLFAIAKTPILMFIFSWTDALTYALVYVGGKFLFDEVLPEHLKITGQMVAMAIYSGGAGIIAPLIFGSVLQYVSYNSSLLILSLIGVLSFILAIKYNQICKRENY